MEAEAAIRRVGWEATETTPRQWPVLVRKEVSFSGSQRRTVSSRPPVRRSDGAPSPGQTHDAVHMESSWAFWMLSSEANFMAIWLTKVSALILENTFTSILDMAGILVPFLKWFIGGSDSKGLKLLNFLVRSPWNTIDVVGQIKQPILFLSGLQDELVPPSHMEMLYARAAACNRQCLFVKFPTGMHMDTWLAGGDKYWRTIQQFMEQTVPDKKDDELQGEEYHKSNGKS
nr:protein bem46 [Ipomoea batatas]